MDRAVYQRMAAQEAEHWWFAGRRAVVSALLDRLSLPRDARILEAGCGTGGNLEMLAGYGSLEAFEYDNDARAEAAAKGFAPVFPGALPEPMPEGEPWDLIVLMDVLEHIEDDRAALAALAGRLAEGGRILITVPAGPWLWSHHDVAHHHFRRYTRAGLNKVLGDAYLKPVSGGHFNTLLYPLAVAQRTVQKLTGSRAPADAQPAPWLNRALRCVFASERHLVGRLPLPVGLSLWTIAER